MALELEGRQRQIVEATLCFANLPAQFKTEAEVARCLAGFVDFRLGGWKPMWFNPETGLEQEEKTFLESYKKAHGVVRDWLTRAAGPNTKQKRAVMKEVEKAIKQSVRPEIAFDGEGALGFTYRFSGAHSVFAFGTGLIFDKRRDLASRLLQCGWCGNLNLELDPKGRPRKFCSGHKVLFFNYKAKSEREEAKAKLKHRRGKL